MISPRDNDTRKTYVTTTPPDFPGHRDWWVRAQLLGMATCLHGRVRHSAGCPGHLRRLAEHRRRIRAARG